MLGAPWSELEEPASSRNSIFVPGQSLAMGLRGSTLSTRFLKYTNGYFTFSRSCWSREEKWSSVRKRPVLSPVKWTLYAPPRAEVLIPPAQGELHPHTIGTDLVEENYELI